MIGWCTAHGEARIALEAGREGTRFENPLLPLTRSEMALPLTSRGRTLGALTIQSDQLSAFSPQDITALQTMADQLANAIENVRLFAQTQAALAEAEATHRRYLAQQWEAYSSARRGSTAYVDGPAGLVPADNQALPDAGLSVPITLRGEPIGVLDFTDEEGKRAWTDEDRAFVEALAGQAALALENARLFEQTQRLASRERLINEITGRVRAAGSVPDILQTAIRELAAAMSVPHAVARLRTPADGEQPDAESKSA